MVWAWPGAAQGMGGGRRVQGWGKERQGYLAVVFVYAVMVSLYIILGEVGGLLTIVSSKQVSLRTFCRVIRMPAS